MGAIIAMEEVLSAFSESPSVYHSLSVLYSTADLPENALGYLEEGLGKWPMDYHMLLNYSSLLLRVGRSQDAVVAVERAVTVEPYNPASWLCLAKALRAAEKDDEAADACREAVRFAPRWSRLEMEARELLREISGAHPNDSSTGR